MYKEIKEQFEYKFNTEKNSVYSIEIKASCKNGKFFGLFGGEDLRVEVDGLKLRELPAKDKSQYYNIPPAWNGTKLKGLSKIVIFILQLKAGKHTIKFIPKRGAVIDKEPSIMEVKNPNDIKFVLKEQAQDGNRRPWITLALIDLPLRILDASAQCEKRKWDSDDVKLIIDGQAQKHESGNWWGKNWYWQGRRLKGDTEDRRFYLNLEKANHYIAFWADRMPMLNDIWIYLGVKKESAEDGKQEETQEEIKEPEKRIPTVDDPKWTGDFNDDTEQMIMARVIFGEGRSLPQKGRVAIGWVVRNRINDSRWANNYHDVILEPKQFSAFNKYDENFEFVKNPFTDETQIDEWRECHEVARKVMQNEVEDSADGANHYFSNFIPDPYWTKWKRAKFKIQIGNTLFYNIKEENQQSGFSKIFVCLSIIIVAMILGIFSVIYLNYRNNCQVITYKHFLINPQTEEIAVFNLDENGQFMDSIQLTNDEYPKSHLERFSGGDMIGYFQMLHKRNENIDLNDEEIKADYYSNYIALMIMKNEDGDPIEVYRGDVHTSTWEWDDNKHVIVYYGCGTECLYAYKINIEAREIVDEYHVYGGGNGEPSNEF